ncbi:MAG: hypothetical protein K9G11_01610 [Rickettsiaceae bacterium]|nr:hypothetical protein [Rickettsiaceae bacterium]
MNIYVEELFALDCHVCSQAHTRNDASALPLEDVAFAFSLIFTVFVSAILCTFRV